MSLTTEALEALALRLAADIDRWQPLVHHDPDARVYELIWEDRHANAWLICWSHDHDTGFHDHDLSAAAITVLGGQVREDRLHLRGGAREIVYGAGETFVVAPNAIHRVLHAGDGPAVTIHAYSPPLTRMGAYTIGEDGELLRAAQTSDQELRARPLRAELALR